MSVHVAFINHLALSSVMTLMAVIFSQRLQDLTFGNRSTSVTAFVLLFKGLQHPTEIMNLALNLLVCCGAHLDDSTLNVGL
jgi:hypothetical protein